MLYKVALFEKHVRSQITT